MTLRRAEQGRHARRQVLLDADETERGGPQRFRHARETRGAREQRLADSDKPEGGAGGTSAVRAHTESVETNLAEAADNPNEDAMNASVDP